jgi:hypothetical protein
LLVMTATTVVDDCLPMETFDDATSIASVASDDAETLEMRPRSSSSHVEDDSASTTSLEQAGVYCNMEFLHNPCNPDK